MTKLPQFEVTFEVYSYSVCWSNGDKRYHFWLDLKGNLKEDTLHCNSTDGHRSLNINAKRWWPTVEAIMTQIAIHDLLAKARQDHKRKIAEEKAKHEADYRTKCISQFNDAANELASKEMLSRILAISDGEKIAFVSCILRRNRS